YVGSGITGPYPVTWRFFENTDLEVVVADLVGNETVKALTTDYTVTGAGEQAGGSLTFTSAIPDDYAITIQPKGTFKQETD
ncbi:hypothetical protein, partial [Streptococcus pneumoniae]|uniref:hypothetical protein n=1 Tax=Streptococcus pneumoniae TaxID=1313 RepID=UPI001E30C2C4